MEPYPWQEWQIYWWSLSPSQIIYCISDAGYFIMTIIGKPMQAGRQGWGWCVNTMGHIYWKIAPPGAPSWLFTKALLLLSVSSATTFRSKIHAEVLIWSLLFIVYLNPTCSVLALDACLSYSDKSSVGPVESNINTKIFTTTQNPGTSTDQTNCHKLVFFLLSQEINTIPVRDRPKGQCVCVFADWIVTWLSNTQHF